MLTITRGYSRNGLACRPWVRRTSAISSLLTMVKSQAELLAHLVLPLQRQAGRAHDDRGAGSMPQQQLLEDQAGFDGLAQTDVVGQQQVGARAGQGATQRLELVGLDRHARPERRLVAVRVGRGDRSPPHGVDEAGQRDRVVEAHPG